MKGYQDNFTSELLIDNFAGGGGASTGIELAIGRPVDIAINHDPSAIAMHRRNHPYTEHYCESVWDIDPRKVCKGRKVGLCWFSPDCKHFSKAKGGKPVEKKVRGLAWIAVRWAALARPRVIVLENVEEFQTWCRIGRDGRPDFRYKGETFRSFVNALKHLGYEVEWRELKACNYGAPTSRKRLFLIARCDGRPIIFPKATHGTGLKPYHTASEIIDWSLPINSIFARNKPLVEATMRRLAKGIDKFVIKNEHRYIISIGSDENGEQKSDEPLDKKTAVSKSFIGAPILTKFNDKSKGQAVDVPIATIMAGATRFGLVAPKLVPFIQSENYNNTPQSIEAPLPTHTTACHHYLTAPKLVPFVEQAFGGNYNGAGSNVNDPLPTITAVDHNRLAVAFMSHFYKGNGTAQASGLDEPARTIMQNNKMAVVSVRLSHSGEELGNWHNVREMLNASANYALMENEILLFAIGGMYYYISDIGMRMLTPRELHNAQGFPKDYKIDFDVNGKAYPKKEQVARCGNAVCPPIAEAIVRANLPEYATTKVATMAELDDAMVG